MHSYISRSPLPPGPLRERLQRILYVGFVLVAIRAANVTAICNGTGARVMHGTARCELWLRCGGSVGCRGSSPAPLRLTAAAGPSPPTPDSLRDPPPFPPHSISVSVCVCGLLCVSWVGMVTAWRPHTSCVRADSDCVRFRFRFL
jgi:hypothetical protein